MRGGNLLPLVSVKVFIVSRYPRNRVFRSLKYPYDPMNALRFVLVLPLILAVPVFSQPPEPESGATSHLFKQARQYHDSGAYAKAIEILDRVSVSDPEYPAACYETALSLYYSGKTEAALARCREADNLHYESSRLPALEGSILDDLGNPAGGIAILEKAVAQWPYNQNILYNLGICYLNSGFPEKAEQVLCRSLLCNPYHTGTNLALARANFAMGRMAQSHLAYQMAILLNPSLTLIGEYENIISGKTDKVSRAYRYPYAAGYEHGHWDELSALIQSEVAFNDVVKYPYGPNYTITREAFLMISNLSPDDRDTTLYNRLYAGFFAAVHKAGFLETYVNYIMKNTSDVAVGKWIASNGDKINAFVELAKNYLNEGRKYGFSPERRARATSYYQFDDNGDLTSIGNQGDADGQKSGKWLVINKEGGVDEQGFYVSDQPEGEYLLYWSNGKVRQRLNFKNGHLHGICQTYYRDGSREGVYDFSNGNKQGHEYTYTASGLPESHYYYRNDTLEGPGKVIFYTDGFSREFTYRNGALEGTKSETWLNGSRKLEAAYTAGELNGSFSEWYANGQKETGLQYINGKRAGAWEQYNYNGTKQSTGVYDTLGLTGTYLAYDNHGNLITRQEFFSKGKLDGVFISYFPDGQRQNVRTYRNDTLIAVESFDGRGNLLHKSDLKDHIIRFRAYFKDGILYSEGDLKDGMQDGTWKYYNPLGILQKEFNYRNDMLQGMQKTYYNNGSIHERYETDSSNIIGPYREYYLNGRVKSAGSYVKAGRQGEWLTWYVNDSLESRVFYKEGDIAGWSFSYAPDGKTSSVEGWDGGEKSIRYMLYDHEGKLEADWDYRFGTCTGTLRFPNGALHHVARYRDNVRDSIQETWYPNGQIARRQEYLHGKLNGTVITHDYEGRLSGEYRYLMGQADGTWKWYENGRLTSEAPYENGLLQGKSTDYYENGKLRNVVEYNQDKQNGFGDFYAPDGSFMYRLRFEDGVLKGYTWKNQAGMFEPEKPVTKSTPEMVCYYPNGRESVRVSLKNGLYHGPYRSFYPDGRKYRETEFEDDQETKTGRYYYPSGKLREEINFIGDERYGAYVLYHENGRKKLEGRYLDGLRDGIWLRFSAYGKQLETLFYHYGTLYEIRKD